MQDNDFAKNNFVLQRLLKKKYSQPEVQSYHLYLENKSQFWKIAKDMFYQFDCYLLWLRKFGAIWSKRHVWGVREEDYNVKISNGKAWYHIDVKINENFTSKHYQMKKKISKSALVENNLIRQTKVGKRN